MRATIASNAKSLSANFIIFTTRIFFELNYQPAFLFYIKSELPFFALVI